MEYNGSLSQVGIFISPSLHKQRNMDGEKLEYEEVYVVQKAEVWIMGTMESNPPLGGNIVI